jgi:putative ATPase
MATAAKSNASALAIWTASKDVKEGRTLPVPKHLRDTHYQGSKRLGHGEGYLYSHDFPGGIVEQDYLGVDKIYYDPVDRGYEAEIRKRMGPRKDSQPTEQQGETETNPPGSADVT